MNNPEQIFKYLKPEYQKLYKCLVKMEGREQGNYTFSQILAELVHYYDADFVFKLITQEDISC